MRIGSTIMHRTPKQKFSAPYKTPSQSAESTSSSLYSLVISSQQFENVVRKSNTSTSRSRDFLSIFSQPSQTTSTAGNGAEENSIESSKLPELDDIFRNDNETFGQIPSKDMRNCEEEISNPLSTNKLRKEKIHGQNQVKFPCDGMTSAMKTPAMSISRQIKNDIPTKTYTKSSKNTNHCSKFIPREEDMLFLPTQESVLGRNTNDPREPKHKMTAKKSYQFKSKHSSVAKSPCYTPKKKKRLQDIMRIPPPENPRSSRDIPLQKTPHSKKIKNNLVSNSKAMELHDKTSRGSKIIKGTNDIGRGSEENINAKKTQSNKDLFNFSLSPNSLRHLVMKKRKRLVKDATTKSLIRLIYKMRDEMAELRHNHQMFLDRYKSSRGNEVTERKTRGAQKIQVCVSSATMDLQNQYSVRSGGSQLSERVGLFEPYRPSKRSRDNTEE